MQFYNIYKNKYIESLDIIDYDDYDINIIN